MNHKNLQTFLPSLILTLACSNFVFGQIWTEDFSYPDATTNPGNGKWSIDVSATNIAASSDWFQVMNNLYEARDLDGEAIWMSESIDISGESNVNISIDFSEDGGHESSDSLDAYYKLDGGTEILFETNGHNIDDFTAVTATQDSLNGSTLQIVIRCSNNAGSEYLRFDNIVVDSQGPIPSPSSVTLGYSTFLGGSGEDYGYDIDVNENGEAFVTGYSTSSSFPTTSGSYDETQNGGSDDAFVSKFSSNGSSLILSTFLGGSSNESGYKIEFQNDIVFLTGLTYSTNFPTQNAYDNSHNGNADVFVVRLSSDGSNLNSSTFLGGSGEDRGFDMKIDANESIFVVGVTQSTNFPTQNSFDNSYNGGNFDAFVTKLSSSGNSLEFSTFIGGNSDDRGYGISVENGFTYITGQTSSSNFPTQNAFDNSLGGNWDTFVTKLSTNGSNLNFSTLFGGSSDDIGDAIIVDASGNSYITGYTSSSNFPTQNAYDSSYNGNTDAFVSKLSSDGSNLIFSTFLGGSSNDHSKGIALDVNGNIFITGYTGSNNFPTQNPTDPSHNGGNDLFITQLTPSGSALNFSTFLGGVNTDSQSSVGNPTTYKNGNLYLTGYVGSGFPTTNGAYDETYNGGTFDAVVSKLTFETAEGELSENNLDLGSVLVSSSSTANVKLYSTGTEDLTVSSLNFTNGTAFATNLTPQTISSGDSTTFTITFAPTSEANFSDTLKVFTNDSDEPFFILALSGFGIAMNPTNNFSVVLDGNDDRLDLPSFNNFPSTEITAEFWMKSFDTTKEGTPISYSQPSNDNEFLIFNYQNFKITIDQTQFSNTGISLNDGSWHHFSLTWKSLTGQANCFVDGVLNTSFNLSQGQSMNSNGFFVIGQDQDSFGGSFDAIQAFEGLIDEVRIWNRALNANEISEKWGKTLNPNLEIGLVGYWDFDEGNGTIASDLSGQGNNLTLQNGTTWGSDIPSLSEASYTYSGIKINEFLPFGLSQNDPEFTEFFEIANTSSQSIDISNLTIENSIGQIITISNGTTIPANSYFVFTDYSSSSLNGGTPFDYSFSPVAFTLSDVSDFIVIKDSSGAVIDSVFYDASWNVSQGESFERKNVQLDSNNPNSWCKGITTYGTENNKGTPGSASNCFEDLADCSVSPNSLNFGNVDFLTSSILSTKIFSTGNGDLTIDSLKFNGTEFNTNLTPQTILSGDSVEFQITYSPKTEGNINDNLTIFTNDWNNFVCQIAVSGNGVDVVAPSQISDFSLISYNGSNAKLRWTATGDDTTTGTANSYEIRQSTSEITEANFSSATLVSNIPTPSTSGILDSVTVSGLSSGSQYYFGIKAIDNGGNESSISTVTSFDRAKITSITDVQNDNGGNVRINFDANFNDYTSGTGLNTNFYAVYRKVNPNYSPIVAKGNNQIFEVLPSGTWEQVALIGAFGEQNYTTVVPTLADSNSTGVHNFEFLVRAVSIVSPSINSVSESVLAHSVDNLPPTVPPNQNFVNNGNGTTTASWNSVYDSDLANYSLWAELAPDDFVFQQLITPTSSGTQSLTFGNVSGAISYAIGSIDLNDNESLPFANRISSLEIEAIGNDVILNWVGKISATVYKIYRSENADLSNSTQIGTYTPNGIEPSFTDFGASQNADKYFYFVTWEY